MLLPPLWGVIMPLGDRENCGEPVDPLPAELGDEPAPSEALATPSGPTARDEPALPPRASSPLLIPG